MLFRSDESEKKLFLGLNEQGKLGYVTGLTLTQELTTLKPLKKIPTDRDLVDVLERSKLDFQVVDGLSALHTKTEQRFAANLAGLRYCFIDGEVAKKRFFEIDHVYSHSAIKEKQEALLIYLNDEKNKEFAAGFLSAKSGKKTIDEYFGRKGEQRSSDGKKLIKEGVGLIQGRKYFYRLCYNDIDNLLMICSACNGAKNSAEALDWFGQQEPFLGQAFVDAVKAAGGLYDGIIVQKIMKVQKGDRTINIGGTLCVLPYTVKIEGSECVLHSGEKATGLGTFVQEWFDNTEYPGLRINMMHSYAKIWLEYKGLVEKELSKITDAAKGKEHARRIHPTISALLQQVFESVKLHYKTFLVDTSITSAASHSVNSSQTDESEDEKLRIAALEENLKNNFMLIHAIKKTFNNFLTGFKNYLEKGVDKPYIYQQLKDAGLYKLSSTEQVLTLENIRDELKTKMSLLSDEGEKLTQEDLTEIITEAVKKYNHAHIGQELDKKAQELDAKELGVREKEQELEAKEQELEAKEQELKVKDGELKVKEQELELKEQELELKEQELERLKTDSLKLQAKQQFKSEQNIPAAANAQGHAVGDPSEFALDLPDSVKRSEGKKRPGQQLNEEDEVILPDSKRAKSQEPFNPDEMHSIDRQVPDKRSSQANILSRLGPLASLQSKLNSASSLNATLRDASAEVSDTALPSMEEAKSSTISVPDQIYSSSSVKTSIADDKDKQEQSNASSSFKLGK